MVTTRELQAYYQRVHGIVPGTPYDPYLHENVPALAFGTVPYDPRDMKGAPLRPDRDLIRGYTLDTEEEDEAQYRTGPSNGKVGLS